MFYAARNRTEAPPRDEANLIGIFGVAKRQTDAEALEVLACRSLPVRRMRLQEVVVEGVAEPRRNE